MRDEGHGLVPADFIILSQRPCHAHPRTLVKSKNGVADTQSAQAQLQLGAATHIVKVQARVTTAASSLLQAGATGAVGKGAVTVEEVRLVKDALIIR